MTKNILFKAMAVYCLLALTIISLPGCGNNAAETTEATPANLIMSQGSLGNTEEPLGVIECNFDYKNDFNTGDSCASRTVSIPCDGCYNLALECEENILWGNVAKVWIFIDGKQVAYDVGRDGLASWQGELRKGASIEFKACAETHGDDCDVQATGQILKWCN